MISEDITFCRNKCNNKKCMRNPCNIRCHDIPHSFAYLKGTDDCPTENEYENN